MQDRRHNARRKTYLGGRVRYYDSTTDCLIKNMDRGGAKLGFNGPALVPEEFDVQVASSERGFRARVKWRGRDELGVAFVGPASGSAVVPFDEASRIRKLEADRSRLEQRIAQLTCGY